MISSIQKVGPGGRSSFSGITVTVFGCTGFLGRYVVNRLRPSRVVCPNRGDEHDHRHLKLMGDLGQIVPMMYSPSNMASLESTVARSNVVINLIGKSRATLHSSLHDTNVEMAGRVAEVTKRLGVADRLIHVSALGADEHSSCEFLRTKALGEQAVREFWPDATIIRPAAMYGVEDQFLNKLGAMASLPFFSNVFPLLAEGQHKVQPVWVGDVAQGIVHAVEDPSTKGKMYSCAGPEALSRTRLARLVFSFIGRPQPVFMPMPASVMDLLGKILNRIPLPGVPFTADELKYLRTNIVLPPGDNVLTLKDLGIAPAPLEEVAAPILRGNFKKGGVFFDVDIAK